MKKKSLKSKSSAAARAGVIKSAGRSAAGSKDRGRCPKSRCGAAIVREPVSPTGEALKSRSTAENKRRFLDQYLSLGGNVAEICRRIGIGRRTVYDWTKDDPKFKEAFDEAAEGMVDFAESKLFKLIDEKNVVAIIFYLKTKGRKRGYVEHIGTDPSDRPHKFEITFNGKNHVVK